MRFGEFINQNEKAVDWKSSVFQAFPVVNLFFHYFYYQDFFKAR